MVDFKKDTWIYVLIAAILALISIFTPIGSISDTQYFFGGVITSTDGTWAGYGAASIWTLALTSMAIALLLDNGIKNMKGTAVKWDWLIYIGCGVAMILFPILMLVYDYDPLDVGFAP
ncbi:MAG: hypothetical protein ACFE9Z_16705, partial [Promethearchaeota archaeon]